MTSSGIRGRKNSLCHSLKPPVSSVVSDIRQHSSQEPTCQLQTGPMTPDILPCRHSGTIRVSTTVGESRQALYATNDSHLPCGSRRSQKERVTKTLGAARQCRFGGRAECDDQGPPLVERPLLGLAKMTWRRLVDKAENHTRAQLIGFKREHLIQQTTPKETVHLGFGKHAAKTCQEEQDRWRQHDELPLYCFLFGESVAW